ncbi:unnamed protein product [Lepidochelys olivacea]
MKQVLIACCWRRKDTLPSGEGNWFEFTDPLVSRKNLIGLLSQPDELPQTVDGETVSTVLQ